MTLAMPIFPELILPLPVPSAPGCCQPLGLPGLVINGF